MWRTLMISLLVAKTSLCWAESGADLSSLADRLKDRWQLQSDSIRWPVGDAHSDHLELSGEQVSAIIYYGADERGHLTLTRKVVWPMLRTLPNDTHASLIHEFPLSVSPEIRIDGEPIASERPQRIEFDGLLSIQSRISDTLTLTRTLSPSTEAPRLVEALTLENRGDKALRIDLSAPDYTVSTPAETGVYGSYRIAAILDRPGRHEIAAGQSITVYLQFVATRNGQQFPFDGAAELQKRRDSVGAIEKKLRLQTPDPVLDRMFDFAKLRASESIFRTKGGLMHGPGGGRYYAAIWANDQAEYANPFFPFLGDNRGNESALNSFRHFAEYMNDEYRPIPSSIIAEGTDYWNGAGDRGDCAMIAYGAGRFALAYGREREARELLPLIDWCLEFSFRKMGEAGVVASDSDELEGRFPAGDINLSTNVLLYGALVSATHLNRELGRERQAEQYRLRARSLRAAIDRYFAATVQGFDTYRYYDGNDRLRAWIALPLTMGIFERKEGTLEALLSPQLWSENGIYTEAGDTTFWDRATLYAFRGIFAAGETDTAMRYFKYYSRKRLLGDHVPYAVEAWPEGNQRHLSAESALYARVVTEGLFGIEPTGFDSFEMAPRLPSGWDSMCLKNIRAFQRDFDLCVERTPKDYKISVADQNGLRQLDWNGSGSIAFDFHSIVKKEG
ncbi:hypothetical protein [Microbulbifer taiwanensis]|uniref:Uncharacterized protein n=1 Tax=Microbulbifer taiwanensis TaxID=986746 RepID=A0ABW1YP74_9GAMM|nr:hypothetical protein [Microbulbifer taiwanensis]